MKQLSPSDEKENKPTYFSKIINRIPSEHEFCTACSELLSEKPIVECQICGIKAHQQCLSLLKSFDWRCLKCDTRNDDANHSCSLCPQTGLIGKKYAIYGVKFIAHLSCYRAAFQIGALNDRESQCMYCGHSGGLIIKCSKVQCRIHFHLGCYQTRGYLLPKKLMNTISNQVKKLNIQTSSPPHFFCVKEIEQIQDEKIRESIFEVVDLRRIWFMDNSAFTEFKSSTEALQAIVNQATFERSQLKSREKIQQMNKVNNQYMLDKYFRVYSSMKNIKDEQLEEYDSEKMQPIKEEFQEAPSTDENQDQASEEQSQEYYKSSLQKKLEMVDQVKFLDDESQTDSETNLQNFKTFYSECIAEFKKNNHSSTLQEAGYCIKLDSEVSDMLFQEQVKIYSIPAFQQLLTRYLVIKGMTRKDKVDFTSKRDDPDVQFWTQFATKYTKHNVKITSFVYKITEVFTDIVPDDFAIQF